MTKEELTTIGLTDDQADAVLKRLEDYVPKSDLEAREADNAELAAQLAGVKFDHALERAMAQGGVLKPEMVKRLLDAQKLEFDEKGGIKGLEEQLDGIRKEAPTLFAPANDAKTRINTGYDGVFRRHAQNAQKEASLGERISKHEAPSSVGGQYFK